MFSKINTKNQRFSKYETPSHKFKSSSKNTPKALIIIGIALLIFVGIYIWGYFFYSNHFLPGTQLSGYDVSNMDYGSAVSLLKNATEEKTVTLVAKDGKEENISASSIGLVLKDSPDVKAKLDNQNIRFWPVSIFTDDKNIASAQETNNDQLNQVVSKLNLVSGPEVTKTEFAKAEYTGNGYSIKNEVYGTELDIEKLKQKIVEAFASGQDRIDLQEENLYVLPSVTKDSETLKNSINALNKATFSSITYDFKTAKETLNKDTFASWLSTDGAGNVSVNQDQTKNYINQLKEKYDTLGKEQPFTTTGGSKISFFNDYTGWEIDLEAENNTLSQLLLNGEQVTREPIYSSIGTDRSNSANPATYLEISIPSQTMWFYKDNKLIVSTPIVSGDVSQGYGTTTGLFDIQAKSTDVVLRGENADGSEYASPVTYWLPFNGGIGVHDATWRSSFGGNIYRGNGSHGCVNTPFNAVQTIYENISVGDLVFVY